MLYSGSRQRNTPRSSSLCSEGSGHSLALSQLDLQVFLCLMWMRPDVKEDQDGAMSSMVEADKMVQPELALY